MKTNLIRPLIAIAALFCAGAITTVTAQTATADTPAADKAATSVTVEPVIMSLELQAALPTGEIAFLAFIDDGRIQTVEEALAYLAGKDIKARVASDEESDVLMQKLGGKDTLYAVAKKLQVGEGDPQTSFRLTRNAETFVYVEKRETAAVKTVADTATGAAGTATPNGG